jgi:hypothetical protein
LLLSRILSLNIEELACYLLTISYAVHWSNHII